MKDFPFLSLLWIVAPALLAYSVHRWRRSVRRRFPAVVFSLFTAVAIACSMGGVTEKAFICADYLVTTAFFFFGTAVGFAAAGSAAVTYLALSLAGYGPGSCLQDLAGFAAAVLLAWSYMHFICRRRRPGLVPCALMGALVVYVHLVVSLLFGVRHVAESYEIYYSFLIGIFLPAPVAMGLVSVALRRIGSWRENFASLASVVPSVVMIAAVAAGLVTGPIATKEIRKQLDYGTETMTAALDDIIGQILMHTGSAMADVIGPLTDETQVDTEALKDLFGIDEISVCDSNGVARFSTIPECVGRSMLERDKTAPYRILTDGTARLHQEPFRMSQDDQTFSCKYAGAALPKGTGFIQLGFSEHHVSKIYRDHFHDEFSDWQVGSGGFILSADAAGEIDADPWGHPGIAGRNLADIGYRADLGASGDGRSEQLLFGLSHMCAERIFAGHRLITCIPYVTYGIAVAGGIGVFSIVLLSVLMVFGALLTRIAEADARITALREEEDRRRAADLKMAQSIQMNVLPRVYPPYPDVFSVSIFAAMHPAREVGGDFYDHYFLEDGRFVFLVADVSGKGIPAAMFMMRAKGTLRSCISSVSDLSLAVTEANAMLAQSNEAEMFVTAWIGVLDTKTGELEYVNAGHNPPYLRQADGSVVCQRALSGLFLAGFEDSVYKAHRLRLKPGESLFLFTDGITEANDPNGDMYGEARLEQALALAPDDPERVCFAVREDVNRFIGTAPQYDDITEMCVVYRGEPERHVLTVDAQIENLPKVSAFVEETLEKEGCPPSVLAQMLIVVDEVCNNIASYSGSPDLTVTCELAHHPAVVRLVFEDTGKPWNPLAHKDPDNTLSVEERPIGGLGILLVKKLMDGVTYDCRGGRNILTVRKSIS